MAETKKDIDANPERMMAKNSSASRRIEDIRQDNEARSLKETPQDKVERVFAGLHDLDFDRIIAEANHTRQVAEDHAVQTAITYLDAKRGEWCVGPDDADSSWESLSMPRNPGNGPEQLREPVVV